VFNTAVGDGALEANIDGGGNTAVGIGSLANNTVSLNTAVGVDALFSNFDGTGNTGVGSLALAANVSGLENVAVGFGAAASTTGGFSVAVGFNALNAATGGQNTAVGDNALVAVTSGVLNTALGDLAGFDVDVGNNINVIGAFQSGISTNLGQMDDSTYISNIWGQPISALSTPLIVGVDSDGKLGTVAIDANGNKTQIGLNDLLEERKKVEEQQASIAELKSTVAQQQKGMEILTAQLKEQAEQIQKVSAQLEVSKPAPQVVTNKP
jgi:uncharacterized coiled-coil protein SlyX